MPALPDPGRALGNDPSVSITLSQTANFLAVSGQMAYLMKCCDVQILAEPQVILFKADQFLVKRQTRLSDPAYILQSAVS